MKKVLRTLLVITLVATLAACGNTDDETRDTLVVGMECNYAPYNWTTLTESDYTVPISGADGEYADGYDVQIAKIIADDLNMDLEIKALDWKALIPSLQNNQIDLIIAGMTDTPDRRESISFTEPYYESEMTIVVMNDSPYINATSIQDFGGAKLIGQESTIFDEVIDQVNGVIHLPAQSTVPRMILSVTSGEADGLVCELPAAYGAVASNSDLQIVRFSEGNGFVADTSISIGTRKEDSDLEASINASLENITDQQRVDLMAEATDRQPAQE